MRPYLLRIILGRSWEIDSFFLTESLLTYQGPVYSHLAQFILKKV